jgi:hypothetical protein
MLGRTDMGLGGNYINFGEDQAKDMHAQAKSSMRKRQEAVTPGHFVSATAQTLREKRDKYKALMTRHLQIRDNFDRAKVGLHKLSSLPVKHQTKLEEIKNNLRNLVKDNQGVGYVLSKCKRILDDTSTVAQLVGEGMKSKIADRHKKAAYQREVAMRLTDIDNEFVRCHESLIKEEKAQKRLLTGLLQLLADSGKKLPPKIQKSTNQKGKMMEIVLEQQNRLRKEEASRVSKPVSAQKMRDKWKIETEVTSADSADSDSVNSADPNPEKALKGWGNFHEEPEPKLGFFNTRLGSGIQAVAIVAVTACVANQVIKVVMSGK